MIKITYEKDSGEVSSREIIPIGFVFDKRPKVSSLDITKLTKEEKEALDDIHYVYKEALIELGVPIRSFFLDGIHVEE